MASPFTAARQAAARPWAAGRCACRSAPRHDRRSCRAGTCRCSRSTAPFAGAQARGPEPAGGGAGTYRCGGRGLLAGRIRPAIVPPCRDIPGRHHPPHQHKRGWGWGRVGQTLHKAGDARQSGQGAPAIVHLVQSLPEYCRYRSRRAGGALRCRSICPGVGHPPRLLAMRQLRDRFGRRPQTHGRSPVRIKHAASATMIAEPVERLPAIDVGSVETTCQLMMCHRRAPAAPDSRWAISGTPGPGPGQPPGSDARLRASYAQLRQRDVDLRIENTATVKLEPGRAIPAGESPSAPRGRCQ